MERTLIDRTPPRVQALYHLVLAFSAAALVGCCSSEQARAQQSATSLEASVGTLHLHGGDQLPGHLVAIDNELLVWQSTWFTTPFEFDLSAVSSIDYPVPAKAMKSEQAFRIVTVNNDVLLGNIVELTNEHLVLESPRHGRVELTLTQIAIVQRHDRSTTGAVGLGLLSDWRTLHHGRKITEWRMTADGEITTEVAGAELFRDLQLASLSEIDITLCWNGKPGFLLSFVGPDAARLGNEVVKLETWENDLVLQTLGANGDFQVIDTISPTTQMLQLRLQWNPLTGDLSVYSANGQLLGTMCGGPVPKDSLSGLYIQNKGAEFRLSRLRANGWTAPNKQLSADSLRVRTNNDQLRFGALVAFDAATNELVLTDNAVKRQKISLRDIDSIDFGHRPLQQRSKAPFRISFLDGTQISGVVRSLRDAVAQIETPYSNTLIRTTTEGLFDISFSRESIPTTAPSTPKRDILHIHNAQLQGTWTALSKADPVVAWRPQGSRNAAQLPTDQPYRIIRTARQPPESDRSSTFCDRVFLRNGDAVPCRIEQIDDTQLRLQVALAENTHIERSMVAAIEFGVPSDSISRGFLDPEWVIELGAEDHVERSSTELQLADRAIFGYRDLGDVSEMQFDIHWNTSVQSMLHVWLFTSEPTAVTPTPSIVFYRMNGNRVVVQAVSPVNAPEIGLGGGGGSTSLPIVDGVTKVRFCFKSNELILFGNDEEVLRLSLDHRRISGRSLTIRANALANANNVAPLAGQQPQTKLVTISEPVVWRTGGTLTQAVIDDQRRERLLTIPRFRKQSPPTIVLVGRNGDFLRGRLISFAHDEMKIVSRLEELTLARDRLSGAIFPENEQTIAAAVDNSDSLAWILYTDGSLMRMTTERIRERTMIGQHPALGRVAIPLPLIREIIVGESAPEPDGARYTDWRLRPAQEPKFAASNDNAQGNDTGTDSPLVGRPAPPFTLQTLGGRPFDIGAQRGKIVVLDFWASWCGPCVKSMPITMQTVAQFDQQEVILLPVNQMENVDTVQSFLETRGWQVESALDPDGQVGQLFQVDALPQLIVIDQAGDVQRVFIGNHMNVHDQLSKTLHQLLLE